MSDCKLEGTPGKSESADEDTFSNRLIEYPHCTKPGEYIGLRVPDVLLNGNHKEINEFRRSDLYEKYISQSN